MSTLITLVIGIFIGWNLPQPAWAKAIQDKLVDMIRGATRM
jgi:type III secretory pathway component EscT